MSGQMSEALPPATREWDGHAVRWEPWEIAPRSVHLEAFAPTDPCDCGDERQPWMAPGLLLPNEGETFASTRVKQAKRSGREYNASVQVPAWPVLRLLAYRCRGCGIEWVLDPYSDES